MISSKLTLTDEFQDVLTNEVGTIVNETTNNSVVIKVGGGAEVLLPRDGVSFQTAVSVSAKNYNSQVAIIGVIK